MRSHSLLHTGNLLEILVESEEEKVIARERKITIGINESLNDLMTSFVFFCFSFFIFVLFCFDRLWMIS